MIETLQSPLNQFYLYAILLITLLLIRKLHAPTVMLGGIYVMMFWVFLASIVGIGSSTAWVYYLQLIIALLAGYALLVIFAWMADKWGPSYNREGFIVILIPLIWSGVILIPVMLLKLIIQAVSSVT